MASTDGKAFTSQTLPAGLSGTVGYDGTRFVSISSKPNDDSSAPVYTSCDGATWTHSADIPKVGGSGFAKIRQVSSGLLASGSLSGTICDPQCEIPYTNGVLVSGKDATQLTAYIIPGEDEDGAGIINFYDAAFDGTTYYLLIGQGLPDDLGFNGLPEDPNTLLSSTDLEHWTPATGLPGSAAINALFNDGSNVYAAGDYGVILSAPASGGAAVSSGASCKALPAIPDHLATAPTPPAPPPSSGGGGVLDLLTLLGFLTLLMTRRRGI